MLKYISKFRQIHLKQIHGSKIPTLPITQDFGHELNKKARFYSISHCSCVNMPILRRSGSGWVDNLIYLMNNRKPRYLAGLIEHLRTPARGNNQPLPPLWPWPGLIRCKLGERLAVCLEVTKWQVEQQEARIGYKAGSREEQTQPFISHPVTWPNSPDLE